MVDQEIRKTLADLGFCSTDVTMGHAIAEYQAFHGLKVDSIAGPVTMRHLRLPRFCKHEDRMELGGEVRKFPGLRVTYANAHPIPGFSLPETEAFTDLAVAEWNKLSAFKATRTTNSKTATVLLTVGQVDGRNGTLAWSELANMPQTLQRYDHQEPWKRGQGSTPAPFPYIDPWLVMLHEFGHAWGLPHAPGGDKTMSATYDAANYRLGAWERQQMVVRYGEAEPGDEPEPTPQPEPAEGLTLFIPGARVL